MLKSIPLTSRYITAGDMLRAGFQLHQADVAAILTQRQREARMEALQMMIEQNTYRPDAEEIADAIFAKHEVLAQDDPTIPVRLDMLHANQTFRVIKPDETFEERYWRDRYAYALVYAFSALVLFSVPAALVWLIWRLVW